MCDPSRCKATALIALAVSAIFGAACRDGPTTPDPSVNNSPVAIDAIPAQTVHVGESVTVNLARFFNDPDGDALTYTATTSDADVTTVSVSGSNAVVTAVSQGNATVTATATDPGGLTAQQPLAVDVPNRPPLAVGSIPQRHLTAGDTARLDLSGYFSDPDGDALTYEASASADGVVVETRGGDTLTIIALSTGTTEVAVTASDAGGLSALQGFSVSVESVLPTLALAIDSAAVSEGGVVALRVVSRPAPMDILEVGYYLGVDEDPATDDADETDYIIDGSLRIEAGADHSTIEIRVRDDDEIEPTREVFTVMLGPPADGADYVLGQSVVTVVTIQEGVCDRTPRVRDALVALTGADDCKDPDDAHLARIDTLDLRGPEPTSRVDVLARHSTAAGQGGFCDRGPDAVSRGSGVVPPSRMAPGCALPAGRPALSGSAPPDPVDPLVELRAGDFSGLSQLKALWLFDNDLTDLPLGIFSGLGQLQVLNLSYNRLAELPDHVFSGLSDLSELWIYENELTRLAPGLFSGLTRLTKLWMSDNALSKLPRDMFSNLSKLQELVVGGNRLEALPGGVFSGLSDLQLLSLRSNRLADLDAAALVDLKSLEWLELGDNRLTRLPPGVFSNLGGLEVLSLVGNHLEELSDGLFDDLTSLVELDLSSNRILELDPALFSDLAGLENLFLHRNRISILQPHTFAELSGLVRLYLAKNRIDGMDSEVFAGLSGLQEIDLSENPLLDLEPEAFTHLTGLNKMWMTKAGFTELPPGVFVGLSRLTRLYLWDNQLSELAEGTFSGLPNLEELWLQYSQIAALPPAAFTGLPKLKTLQLYSNRLTDLPDDLFTNLDDLVELDLRDNPGVPFPLAVQLQRTDNADLAAPGPAKVVAVLRQGAPFRVSVPLTVHRGTLSTDLVVIERGQTTSAEFTVTINPNSRTGTDIVVGPASTVPGALHGIEIVVPERMRLFN